MKRLSLAWVIGRLFRLARTPAGRKVLLFLWTAAVRWRGRKSAAAARL